MLNNMRLVNIGRFPNSFGQIFYLLIYQILFLLTLYAEKD